MYSNLPGPFCFLTENHIFIGILEDEEFRILSNAVLISKGNKNKWRNQDEWLANLVSTPTEGMFTSHSVGYVDLENELCTVISCSEKWLPLLKIGAPYAVHSETSSVVNLHDN